MSLISLFFWGEIQVSLPTSSNFYQNSHKMSVGIYNKTYQEWWIRSLKPMSGLSGRKNSRVAKPRVGSVGQTDHEWVSRI